MAEVLESGNDLAVDVEPRAWLFVGDFLFYLRLLARQLANLARENGGKHKSMLIVPHSSMAWEQLDKGNCEVVFIDCAEATAMDLDFIRALSERHPSVRRILVSAALNQKMESELMAAGVHLCFSKPRSSEETFSMYQLVSALSHSRGFCPNGAFKGMAPARFIQFLCARGESGMLSMETEKGKATLVVENGEIVDASLGDLQGAEAAAVILSLDRSGQCLFKHGSTTEFHPVRMNTSQLWLDSDKVKSARPKEPSAVRKTSPSKPLQGTMTALETSEKLSLHVQLEPEDFQVPLRPHPPY